jgi:hypothetical protein
MDKKTAETQMSKNYMKRFTTILEYWNFILHKENTN